MPVDSKRLRGAGQRSQLCHNERPVVRFAREQHASRFVRTHMLRFAARRACIDLAWRHLLRCRNGSDSGHGRNGLVAALRFACVLIRCKEARHAEEARAHWLREHGKRHREGHRVGRLIAPDEIVVSDVAAASQDALRASWDARGRATTPRRLMGPRWFSSRSSHSISMMW